MREIKFRAWFGAENRWLCGYNADGEGCNILGETIGLAGGFVGEVGIGEELNTVIVEQYTGLHDKNGKDIYEGDIIILGTNKPCKVNYDDKRACFSADLIGRGNTCFHTDFWSKGEVVGNIHENPELLKG